ncbi:MAG: type II toxin-antitoxin system Phd/YefM family antitoxin [Candidatus Margulisbacteria bacterium]|jgi:PHD/YefM family antitoxin component YafN of YafNO toxin-antitoxin module|nr:type II toxin-antitoxin system Phd/YefM family antitoxin [Candidatus Margulisiibacteriota bacterium]
MPVIRKSADLRNKYSEISDFCHKYREPVFITRNGEGDLAVMSMETYETMSGRQELYAMVNEGLEQVRPGKIKPAREALTALRKKLRI